VTSFIGSVIRLSTNVASENVTSVGTASESYSTSVAPTGIDGQIVTPPTVPGTESPIPEWLNSPESRQYEGQWVVLSPDADVLAAADSPDPTLITGTKNSLIFVLPVGARIG
jgi:hypothetical protein